MGAKCSILVGKTEAKAGERRTTPSQSHAAGERPPRKGLQLEPASSLVAGTRATSWWSGGTWCPRGQREASGSTETSRGCTGVIPGGRTHPGLCGGSPSKAATLPSLVSSRWVTGRACLNFRFVSLRTRTGEGKLKQPCRVTELLIVLSDPWDRGWH